VIVTFKAAWLKVFSPVPRIGFLAQAGQLQAALESGAIAATRTAQTNTLIFNNLLDAAVCCVFMILVAVILVDSLRVWIAILRGRRSAAVVEAPFVLSQLSPEGV